MDLDQARRFVRDHHRAVLATRTPSGGVQQSPVLVTVDDEGRFVVSSRETAYKTRNLRLDPWAQLCVLPDGFFGDWVYVEGRVDVLSLPEAEDPLVEYYRAASGEHPDWAEYRASLHDQRRVALLLTAGRAGPDRSG
jgi:PPOX class probable F420-dependent enzyme